MNSKRTILFILVWCGVALSVPYLALNLFFADRKLDDRLEQFYERADKIEALSLGSSHTRDLHFPSMGLNGYSFADDGGDIEIAEYKLRRIVGYTPALRYVFLTVGPGFLSYNRISGVPGEFPGDYIRYTPPGQQFSSFNPRDIYWSIRAWLLGIRSDVILANRLSREFLRNAIRRSAGNDGEKHDECQFRDNPADHPHEDGILDGFARIPIASHCMTPEFEALDALRRVEMIERSLRDNPDTVTENLEYLKRMSGLLKAHGARLVIVISPTSPRYFDHEGLHALWETEWPVLKDFAAQQDALILDRHEMFFDMPYDTQNNWFSDPNHLTYEGARIFSRAIGEDLEKRLESE